MVVADYLREKLIEPLEEHRRQEAQRREQRARAEGEARNQAVWVARNERRLAAETSGEPFEEAPPGTSSTEGE